MLNDVLRGAGVAELRSAGAGTGVPVPGNANTHQLSIRVSTLINVEI